jgi:homogentisate 1,2-dioxygenase
MYRIRPSAQHGEFVPLAHRTFTSDFTGEAPEPGPAGFAPLEVPKEPADFVDGMATVGGAGSPLLRRGFAVHVYAANRSMEARALCNADGDFLVLPELGALSVVTELGVLDVDPGMLVILPRGLRFSVLLRDGVARGYVAEAFGRPFVLPERGPAGANGLADARHFRAPTAWHEDRLAPGFRVTTKLGGALYEATQDYSPYDVVAWHGNHAPYAYDLSAFSPLGGVRFDHPDPSVYSVLSAPMDEQGASTLDLIVFPPRWDVSEGTFRPPYLHRNAVSEFNGIIKEVRDPRPPFVPGAYFLTPCMTPHGAVVGSVERALSAPAARADEPRRTSNQALWFQFETALPFSLSPWAKTAENRAPGWQAMWGPYRTHFRRDI